MEPVQLKELRNELASADEILTANGTYFTPVTRSVSEGNKGITSLVIALAYAAG